MRALPRPLSMLPLVFSALAVAACGENAAHTPPPVSRAPVIDLPRPTATAPPDAPPPVACSDVLRRLPFGRQVHDIDSYIINQGAERDKLADAMPSLDAQGLELLSAAGIELPGDPSARLVFVARKEVRQQRSDRGPFSSIERGIATCTADRGYALLGAPSHFASNARADVLGVERVRLPGGAAGVSVTTQVSAADGDLDDTVIVLGAGTQALPVLDPPGAAAGILAGPFRVGEGRRVGNDYKYDFRLDASGFYPLGEALAYLHLRADDADVRLQVRAVIAADGAEGYGLSAKAPRTSWALAGPGAPPAWCTSPRAAGRVRCTAIEAPYFSLTVPPAFGWIAGLWLTPDDAAAALAALGADLTDTQWLVADPADPARPPKGPDGKPAVTVIRLGKKPPPPAPPPHP